MHLLPISLVAMIAMALPAPAASQQFGALAPLPGDLDLGPSAGNQSNSATANGDGHHLVVWEDDASSLVDTVFGQGSFGSSAIGNRDIHGMLFDDEGTALLPAPIVIAREPWDQLLPQVAWNGSEYLVVFQTTRPTPAFYSAGIEAVRVSAAGAVVDQVPFTIHDDPSYDEFMPVVASVGGDWLVGWSGRNGGTPRLEGRKVLGTGVVGPLQVLATASAGFATSFDLASSGGLYAIVFSVSYGQGLRARLFDSSGAPTGAVFTLQSNGGNRPSIAGGPAGFYCAWNYAGLRGTTIDLAGNVGSTGGALLVAPPLSVYSESGTCWDGTRYTVVYDDGPELRLVALDVAGNLLSGPTVLTTTPRTLSNVAVTSSPSRTHVTWTDLRASTGIFGPQPDDIWRTSVSASGTIDTPEVASASPPAQFRARIAGDAQHGFLVVFNSWRADRVRILAQAMDAHGDALTAEPFVVAEDSDRTLYDPDIAWNGSEFLVTWTRLQSITPSGPPPLVQARRCLLDGTLLDTTPVTLMNGRGAAVDAVGGTFLVAAGFQHPILQQNSAIFARRIEGATGNLPDAAPIYVDGSAGSVDVVGLVDRWFIGFLGVRLAILDQSGGLINQFYAADNGASGSSYLRLAANPARTEVLLAYEARSPSNLISTTDIRMRRFAADGSSTDPFLGPLVTTAANAQLRPACASLGDELLFAWADHRDHDTIEPGLGDVYASRVSFAGNLLDPLGTPVLDGAGPEGSVELLASGGGRALFAASWVERDGPRAAVHRVRTGRYEGPSLGSVSCTQPVPNSSGNFGELELLGSSSVDDDDLTLLAHSLPPNKAGIFLVSRMPGNVPGVGGGLGTLCLGSPLARYMGPGQLRFSGSAGTFELAVKPSQTPTPAGLIPVLAGETWFYQAWHRDVVGGLSTSNLSSARAMVFR